MAARSAGARVPRRPRRLLAPVVLTAACFGLSSLGYLYYFAEQEVAAFWPLNGAFAALLATTPRREWPWMILCLLTGIHASDLAHGIPVGEMIAFTVADATEAIVGGVLLGRALRPSVPLRRRTLSFFAVTLLVPVGCVLLGSLAAAPSSPEIGFALQVQTWWFADTLGFLVAAPVILAARGSLSGEPVQSTPATCAVPVVLITSLSLLAFLISGSLLPEVMEVPYLVLPLIFWTAVHYQQVTVMASILCAALVALTATALGHGPFLLGDSIRANVLSTQVFLAVMSTAGLLLYLVNWERRRLEQRLRESAKLEAVGRLAGGIAHDFNNLLTPVLLSCHMLEKRAASDPAMRREIAIIRESARHAGDITSQLLAYARRKPPSEGVLDLREVVSRADRMLDRLVGGEIERRIELPSAPCLVEASLSQMVQVVLELALNARDAMPGGGVLTVRLARLDDERCVLFVEDTGHGMDRATRAHIFEPFYSTKQGSRGIGLGLAVAFASVDEIGGAIECDSQIGRGTSFRITLPLARRDPASELPASRWTAPTPTSVLLVEDEPAVLSAIERALREQGFEVVTARRGDEAATVPQPKRFGLVVADADLPGLSGLGLVEHLRARGCAASVLIISGYPRESLEDWPEDAGLLFLQKPFSPVELMAAIGEATGADAGARQTGVAR